jgi:hypothetical protein
MWYSTYLEQPFCSRYFVYFVLNKWYGWKCGLHDYDVIVTVPAGATRNGIGTNNCGYN